MDGQQPFAVVNFVVDGTFSEVPSIWLCDNNKQCWWPNVKNASSLIAKSVAPDENSWQKYDIELIRFCHTLESARKSAEASDYTSASEDCGKGMRKRKKPLRIHDNSDVTSSDDEGLPPLPTLKAGDIIDLNKTPMVITQILDDTSQTPGIHTSTQSDEIGNNLGSNSFEISRHIDTINTPSPTLTPTSSRSIVSGHSTIVYDKTLNVCTSILMHVRSIDERLKKLERGAPSEDSTDHLNFSNKLPLTTEDALNEFEIFVANQENKMKFINYLRSIGGRHAKDFVQRMLQRVFSNGLCVRCSWLGQRGNRRMKGLESINILKEVLQAVYVTTTEVDFEQWVSEWLRLAKLRLQREEKKK